MLSSDGELPSRVFASSSDDWKLFEREPDQGQKILFAEPLVLSQLEGRDDNDRDESPD